MSTIESVMRASLSVRGVSGMAPDSDSANAAEWSFTKSCRMVLRRVACGEGGKGITVRIKQQAGRRKTLGFVLTHGRAKALADERQKGPLLAAKFKRRKCEKNYITRQPGRAKPVKFASAQVCHGEAGEGAPRGHSVNRDKRT